MNFARALVRDLVDKRLWPLAVLLVAALIAVPLLLGGGGDAGEGTPLPAAAVDEATSVAAAQTAPVVELVGPASVRSRPGGLRDPFRRAKPKVVKAAVAQTPAAANTAPAGDSKPSVSGPPDSAPPVSTPPDTTPDISQPPAEKPFAYRTEVRFARTGQDAGKAHGISRLTPLGGLTAPALLYLGASAGGKYAIFLLGPTARATGDGKCAAADCRIIGLKAGKSTSVEVISAKGASRRYSLEVVSVERDEMASQSDADRARSRVHPDGRDVLRNMIHDGSTAQAVGRAMYVQALGVVVARSGG